MHEKVERTKGWFGVFLNLLPKRNIHLVPIYTEVLVNLKFVYTPVQLFFSRLFMFGYPEYNTALFQKTLPSMALSKKKF